MVTDNLPKNISRQDFKKLSTEINRLGHALGAVIKKVDGPQTLESEEEIRLLARASRRGDPEAAGKLSAVVRSLDMHDAYAMAMAFTTYFELVNLSEENHRIALLQQHRAEAWSKASAPPPRESIEAAIVELKRQGVTARDLQALLNKISIELVFTAHPTEAKRRALLRKIKRLAGMLRHQEAPWAGSLRPLTEADIEREITSLWLTERSHVVRPEVTDEVHRGLWYFSTTLYDTLPQLQADLDRALARHYPGVKAPTRWLTFGSWIGGDRDGNPNVTASVTAETLVLHRQLALEKLRAAAQQASLLLSVSTRRDRISSRLKKLLKENKHLSEYIESLTDRYPNEPYRLLLAGLRSRLAEALEETAAGMLLEEGEQRRFLSGEDVAESMDAVIESLESSRAAALAEGEIRFLRHQLEVFSMHVARLDLRQHSSRHEAAVAEILKGLKIEESYGGLSEEEKLRVLDRAHDEATEGAHEKAGSLSKETRDVLDPIALAGRAQKAFGKEAVGIYLISMTDDLSDILEVLLMLRWCGVSLDISPLFETLDDLNRAPAILKAMFNHSVYRKYLTERGDHQHVMLGYSDSNKDCGYLTANWALFVAQEEIARVCGGHQVKLTVFHGRGGTIARGGGPAAKAILAQPCGLRDGGIRITEQGEVLSTRYHDPDIAHRILEQVAYGVLLGAHAARREIEIPEDWRKAMNEMAQRGFDVYRKLVHEDPDFIQFWREATPIDEISNLKLGSRPAFRKATKTVDDLRAIPWVFSWNQSRFAFPGWYGLGSALETILDSGRSGVALLRKMYREWTFFQTVIDNAQLTLVKADMKIAAIYAGLVKDKAVRERIFSILRQEFERTEKAILRVTGQKALLQKEPVLLRSIHLRNPYIDPLNYIQVEMIQRLRAQEKLPAGDADAIRAVIELTINGLSSGLKSTG